MDAGLLASDSGSPSVRLYNRTVFDSQHVYVRRSPMRFNKSAIVFRAGFILGARRPMLLLINRFLLKLTMIVDENIPLCYDEEAILTQIYRKDTSVQDVIEFVGNRP